jgi:predicted transcriptional regulator
MSFSCAEIETRINQAMNHLTKNPCTKVARVTREFNVSVQRLRRRMRDIQSASDVREMHERRLKSDQNLVLKIYIRKLIQFDLHSRLNVIKSAATKLLMQNASESSSFSSLNHM